MSSSEFTRFCKLEDLPPGSKKASKVNNHWVLVCHTRDDRLFAVSNICSHAVRPLAGGRMRHCTITCPVHGAKFDLETGEALALPATKPIPTYELRVVDDDWIEVCVPGPKAI